MKLIEQIKINSGAGYDICDKIFEIAPFCVECETSAECCTDPYDAFCFWFASNVEIVEAVPQQYGTLMICNICELIEKHYNVFSEYCARHNRLDFIMNKDDRNDSLEIALLTIRNMIAGNYSMEDYLDFLNILKEDVKND